MEGEYLMLGWRRKQARIYVSSCEMYAITDFNGNWQPWYTGGKTALQLTKNPFRNFGHAEYICALHELMEHPQRSS